MDSDHQLDLLHQLSQLLLSREALPQRLNRVLKQLQTVMPFEHARMVVLPGAASGGGSWSIVVPSQAEQSGPDGTAARWPKTFTAEVLRGRAGSAAAGTPTEAPVQHQVDAERVYIGWPIRWQHHIYGALELLMPHSRQEPGAWSLIQALLPLFATALSQPQSRDGITSIALLAPTEQQYLDAYAAQLQAPLLLHPLLAHVLQWSLEHSGAVRGSIHLAEANGHGLHLLAFELADQRLRTTTNGTTALVHSRRNHDLAKIALANGRAMVRQAGDETEFAAPILHEGRLLGAVTVGGPAMEHKALMFVQCLAELAGPAVVRAQFYQQLADARTHLQHVFDELPTGLALTDAEGNLLRANPAWWRLWGLDVTVAEHVKLVPWDILPRILTRLPDPLAFSDLFTRPATTPNEAVIVLQNPWQELRIVFMPVRDTLGLQAGFLLAVDDVTREREVDRLKSEFVSVVSHELRTPLTSILGYTELLLAREFEPAERKEFIQTVHKEADHLSSLVEDLLNVSRLDAGKIKLERWVMALPKLVRELVAQLNKELDGERHRLLLDVPENLPPIYADRDRVRQILSNLLSNAIKYSPEGGEVVLHASVLHRPPHSAPLLPPEPALLISVRDCGIGIPQHELTRIFERFYRVDNSNTRRIGGTGLGLAITRALVELHGGRIWAESTPGDGSTFYVTLPIATEMLRTRP